MNFEPYFEYSGGFIPKESIHELTAEKLVDIYVEHDEIFKSNMFTHLLNEYYYLLNKNCNKEAAHVCYLISYYFYLLNSVPHCYELAAVFAQKAIECCEELFYSEWFEKLKEGVVEEYGSDWLDEIEQNYGIK